MSRGDKKHAIEQHVRRGVAHDEVIAKEVGCSASYVRYIRGRLGVYRKPWQVKNRTRLTQIIE